MEPGKYLQFIMNTSNHIRNAAGDVAEVGMDGEWWGADHAAARFVARTADAAEHLAKAMLGRRGIDPHPTHGVEDLADRAAREGHSALAEAVREMDGFT